MGLPQNQILPKNLMALWEFQQLVKIVLQAFTNMKKNFLFSLFDFRQDLEILYFRVLSKMVGLLKLTVKNAKEREGYSDKL